MNGITLSLRVLHRGEKHLARELQLVADRHRTDHEVHHVATDLARWSEEHALRLAQAAHDQGLDLDDSSGTSSGVLAELRRKAAEAVGHRPEPGLLLLRDLRALHLDATENSLHWEMLAQVAQATRNDALLTLASECHPQTLRQIRWTNTMIRNLSPQILASL
ncbi:hypothetical protein SAMN05216532_7832 [Streptomyces sp. 2231.1]|uniref:hypothetical protein n=1 Tax=Streptomyces sp. 2231.1 TaxID=1855347 RepID=UPI0008947AE7|nr:hypothetical protein [Streptomyces sp. 2231.1]SEE34161.1 hypothetical protein SAMN05216532_7832 [Streptomyces sp. 2231.1]